MVKPPPGLFGPAVGSLNLVLGGNGAVMSVDGLLE